MSALTADCVRLQVALIGAEREVLTLRSQLSHRQQHIKLLEQRLLEQSQVGPAKALLLDEVLRYFGTALSSCPHGNMCAVHEAHFTACVPLLPSCVQDVAAMINRGDPARAASPLASRMGSFADKEQPAAALRRLPGSGTELLQPQDAWDFTAVQDAEGNLAMQMSRHVSGGMCLEQRLWLRLTLWPNAMDANCVDKLLYGP